ncbi:MAG: hypothetical protein Kapaf2KO_11180 [Candidatus Kapaibacteriales bacterium]
MLFIEERYLIEYCYRFIEDDGGEVTEEDWEIVAEFSVSYEADIAKGLLIEHGVPAVILDQADSMRPFGFGSLSIYKLLVPKSLVKRAEVLLRS